MSIALEFMFTIFLGWYGIGIWYVISTFFCIVMEETSIEQASPALKNIAMGKAALAKLFQLIDREPTLKEAIEGIIIDRINSISRR
jgi:hypothetical protein